MKWAKELILLGLVVLAASAAPATEPTLLDIQKLLASKRFVDLTHAFEPGYPTVARLSRRKARDGILV